jgi:hypothetical protein
MGSPIGGRVLLCQSPRGRRGGGGDAVPGETMEVVGHWVWYAGNAGSEGFESVVVMMLEEPGPTKPPEHTSGPSCQLT